MSEHVRILLVGDSGVDKAAVLSEIERSGLDHELARAKSEAEMIDACRHGRPDVILALDSDDTFDAVAAMAVSREMCDGIPLIVIANAAGEEVAVEALKAGATDYVIADRLGRLASAIGRALEQARARRARDTADLALRESEARFRGIFENSPIGITIRRGPRLVYLNPAYLRLVGYRDLDSVPDHSLLSLIAPETLKAHREMFVSLTPPQGTFEERALRSDGTTFPTEVTVNNVELSDGPATVAFVSDITERKRAEEELDHYSRDLERMVKARTDQLLEADAALQRVTDTRIRFLSSMSHELRVPLNSVIGFSGVLLQGLPGPLTDEQRRQIEIIMAAGRRLTATIDDVLDISGIEAGKAELEWEQFELDTMIESLAGEYEPLARKRGVQIVMCRPDAPVRVVSDRRKVGKIVQELLDNAVKFTPAGSIHVSPMEDGDSVSVSVRDSGIGIAPADLPLIFEEFQQAKLPDGGRPDGSGLGLAICHRLAELLGGSLTAVSERAGQRRRVHVAAAARSRPRRRGGGCLG
jgi:PAS domain S-box-containing protein